MQRQPIHALIAALAVAMAPLVFQLPLWTIVWCVIAWSYLLVRDARGWPILSRGVRSAIFIVGLAAVLMAAGLRFDGGDFIALLAVMAGLKPLEVTSRRDSMITVFLAYFMTITSLFVFENLSMTIYLFASVWITTGVLVHVNDPKGAIRQQLKVAARLMLVAVPLMALLFLLFPRLSGSFWGSPWSRYARSGFSSSMRIGDVSRLVLVDDPVFSVSFDSNVPQMNQLYWRGIVFQRFDGRTWHHNRNQVIRRGNVGGKDLSRYTVVLEPHGDRHLFVLDIPVTANPVATILDDHTLVARRPIRQRFHYGVASMLDYRPNAAAGPGDGYLQLPPNRNSRTMALGRKWARTHASPGAVVAAGLAFFREKEFVYTLRPNRLGADAVDDFLFGSRRGFCEHYATAFTVLMRSAGVPTRIVGGYQGGQWNPIGKFLTVRQADAHAWCEVWIPGKGWMRVDPTFVVAPERIDAGIESALAGELPGFLGGHSDGLLARWSDRLVLTWEAINTRWNMWFMGFSVEDQMALLKRLGIPLKRQAGWLLFMVLPPLFIGLLFLAGRMTVKKNPHHTKSQDLVLRIYARFLRKMARIGLTKASYLGPLDYARLVAVRQPELAQQVNEIAGIYIGLRYARGGDAELLKVFHRTVRQFKPNRAAALEGPGMDDIEPKAEGGKLQTR